MGRGRDGTFALARRADGADSDGENIELRMAGEHERWRSRMRVLVIGAGGVGTAVAQTAAKWNLFERVVVADYDARPGRNGQWPGRATVSPPYKLDGSDENAVVSLIKARRSTRCSTPSIPGS